MLNNGAASVVTLHARIGAGTPDGVPPRMHLRPLHRYLHASFNAANQV
jgi:hypothetical protein